MPSDLNEQMLLLYRRARLLHQDAFSLLDNVKSECRSAGEAGAVVDAVFLLKKTNNYIDGIRKEVNRCLEFVQRLGALHAMQTEDNSLRGEVASGYASTSQQCLLPDPKTDPAGYSELMQAIGAPELSTIRPSFSGVEELVTKLNEEGKQLPPGLAHCRTVDKFTITAKAKSGVDLDVLADHVHKEHGDGNPQPSPKNNEDPF